MKEAPPTLEITHLSKTFGGQAALRDVGLSVAVGEVHGLLGQNGSGKSTLIKVLAGFHAPDAGSRLRMNGVDVSLPLPPGGSRLHRMSFVHQNLGLIPSLTILENLLIGRLARRDEWRIDWPNERRRARRRFEHHQVALDPMTLVSDLAPVQRALLAIIRATDEIEGAEEQGGGVLILDEPTPFLPRRDVEQLFRLMRSVVDRGASAIFVSHDVDEVMEITDHVTVLRDGRVAARLKTRETVRQDVVEAIIGRRPSPVSPVASAASLAEPHIVVDNVAGETVEGFMLQASRGEIIGLTGLVGAGYDEICHLLYGSRAARSGTLAIGKARAIPLARLSPARAIATGIVLIPADRPAAGIIGGLPVTDNVTMPVIGRRFHPWRLRRTAMTALARELASVYDVRPPDPDLNMASLSGGNQQKVVLAKWLQCDPALVLLDEPTQGVDIGARETLFARIKEAAAMGAVILCASSDYEQLAAICTRVLVLSRGRVIASLQGTDINKHTIAERCLDSLEETKTDVPTSEQQSAGG